MSSFLQKARTKTLPKRDRKLLPFYIAIQHFDIPNYKPSHINGYRSF